MSRERKRGQAGKTRTKETDADGGDGDGEDEGGGERHTFETCGKKTWLHKNKLKIRIGMYIHGNIFLNTCT